MSNRPTHLSPKTFLALEDARIALEALTISLSEARAELRRLEERAAALLLSDQDVRDLLSDYAVNRLARSLHVAEHGYQTGVNEAADAEWSRLVFEGQRLEDRIRAVGDNFQRAREAMAQRIAEEAKRGAAA